MGLAGLIGENIWLLLVLALITVVVAVELGIIGKVKNSISNAISGLQTILENMISFDNTAVLIKSMIQLGIINALTTGSIGFTTVQNV